MMLDHERILYDGAGEHERPGVTIALVGPMVCDIHWAINAMSVHLPVNASRELYVYPHPSVDTARNLAIEAWLKDGEKGTRFLFVWPNGQGLQWDSISEAMTKARPVLKIGDAFCLDRKHVSTDSAPWFKEGKWLGAYEEGAELVGDSGEYVVANVEKPQGVVGEQLFVLCVPSLGKTSLFWVSHMIQMAGPVGMCKFTALAIGYEVAEARQKLVDAVLALEPEPAFLFFVGDDMLFEANALQLLFETMKTENVPAVSGLYHMKYRPPSQPLLWRAKDAGWLMPGVDFKPGDVVRCAGTGLDACLIKPAELRKMSRPHFKTGHEKIPGVGISIHTEDAFFWHKWQAEIGHPAVVDTRVRVGHFNHHDGAVY